MDRSWVRNIQFGDRSRHKHFISAAIEVLQLSCCALASDFSLGQDDDVVCQDINFVQEVSGENNAALGALLQKNLPDYTSREGIQA